MSSGESVDLECPKCHRSSSRVVDSRGSRRGYIRRRRECLYCKHRYSTREILVEQAVLRIELEGRVAQLTDAITLLRDELHLPMVAPHRKR